jgi:hypothetical protein
LGKGPNPENLLKTKRRKGDFPPPNPDNILKIKPLTINPTRAGSGVQNVQQARCQIVRSSRLNIPAMAWNSGWNFELMTSGFCL